MDKFVQKLPKIELHAHLNGSLSEETFEKLIKLRNSEHSGDSFNDNLSNYRCFDDVFTMESCFEKFKLAHALVDSVEAVKLATEQVIKEFSQENVILLELRSTPRKTDTMTKEECLQAIVNTIISCQETYPNILVKLIPSINRAYGVAEAEENTQLIFKMHDQYPDIIRGIDLSGDPSCAKFSDYKEMLNVAKDKGIKLALHCAEVANEDEIMEMLNFGMDRLGHGTFIDDSNVTLWNLFLEKQIVVECCLSSNVLCGTVPNFESHHFNKLRQLNHPLVICTDDYGVFSTTLTKELIICAKTFNLNENDLLKLSEDAIKHSFTTQDEKDMLTQKFKLFSSFLNSEETDLIKF